MNEFAAQIIQSTNGHLFLKRLIDHIFLAWTSESVTGDMLLSMANNLNDAIKFTIESPTNNQLPYLDNLVSFDSTIPTNFLPHYMSKPIHSTCIIPWYSHESIASKRSVLIGEIRRAISRSTDSIFTSNGYPKQFVRSVIQQTLYTEPQRDNQEGCIYLKLPYIDEVFKRRALATIRRTGIGNIRVHFKNGQQISKIYAPKKDKLSCTIDCAWYLQTLRKDKSVPHQEYGLPHKFPTMSESLRG